MALVKDDVFRVFEVTLVKEDVFRGFEVTPVKDDVFRVLRSGSSEGRCI